MGYPLGVVNIKVDLSCLWLPVVCAYCPGLHDDPLLLSNMILKTNVQLLLFAAGVDVIRLCYE